MKLIASILPMLLASCLTEVPAEEPALTIDPKVVAAEYNRCFTWIVAARSDEPERILNTNWAQLDRDCTIISNQMAEHKARADAEKQALLKAKSKT